MSVELAAYVGVGMVVGSLAMLAILVVTGDRRPPMDDPGALPLGYRVEVSGGLTVLFSPDDDQFGEVFSSVPEAADAAWSMHGRRLAAKMRREAELERRVHS